jgi:hypothetical protein
MAQQRSVTASARTAIETPVISIICVVVDRQRHPIVPRRIRGLLAVQASHGVLE